MSARARSAPRGCGAAVRRAIAVLGVTLAMPACSNGERARRDSVAADSARAASEARAKEEVPSRAAPTRREMAPPGALQVGPGTGATGQPAATRSARDTLPARRDTSPARRDSLSAPGVDDPAA